MGYQATYISSEEFDILADEPAEYFKLYAYLRSKMNIQTRISGIESRFNTQAFRELLSVPDKKGRHKKHEKLTEEYNSGMIQKRLNYLEKIGLIKRRKDLGCFVFEHILPILPKSVQMYEGPMREPMTDSMRVSKKPLKPLVRKDSLMDDGQHEGMYEEAMRVTPHRYSDIQILRDIDKSISCSKPSVSERNLVNSQLKNKFDEFWDLYPRRSGKQACMRKFNTISKKKVEIADKIISGLRSQLDELKNREPQFIPLPLTWLNQGRWEDEVKQKESWRW